MAFDGLSEKLNGIFKKLRSKGRLNESDVKDAMREVKLALLEADVNFKVVKTFVNAVFVYDDKVVLTFHYSGDDRTITLNEIDGELQHGVRISTFDAHQKSRCPFRVSAFLLVGDSKNQMQCGRALLARA